MSITTTVTTDSWLQELDKALEAAAQQPAERHPAVITGDDPVVGLLNVVQPLVQLSGDQFLSDLDDVHRRFPQLDLDPAMFVRHWLGDFSPRIFTMLARTLVLELHVASAEGRLAGNTPEQRYQAFCNQLQNPQTVRALMLEYPVLAEQLILTIRQRIDFGLEFAERLGRDWLLLCDTFAPGGSPGRLIRFHPSQGDSHRGGRHVLIAEFESGLKLVYKPRSMSVDVHFQQLVQWFNERGDHPALRTLQVLDRGDYGWSEFVSAETCHSRDEVQRFYQRQGAYVALLYVLQATDFHSENLIAAGEHPVLVDLESLLTPQQDAFEGVEASDRAVSDAFVDSVLRAGILPHGVFAYGDEEGIDISGLGTVAGKRTPYRVPFFVDAGTDRMRLQRERREMAPNNNRPMLNDKEVELLAFRDALRAGFHSGYHTLLAHRDELTAGDGPLCAFAGDQVRPILRMTQSYAFLLEESYHPDLMRDGSERECLFNRLEYETATNPRLAEVLPAERDDLHNGDVPIFTARTNSTHVWTSRGEQIPDYFQQPGLAAAMNCLERLGTEDLDRQTWLLDASLATTVTGPHMVSEPQSPRTVSAPSISQPDAREFIDAARVIGDRIGQLAIRSQGEANWLGLTLVGERQTGIRPLELDLYDGLPGLALFFAYLGEITGDAQYTRLAEQCLRTVLRGVGGQEKLAGAIGAFDGWGGLIYTLTHLGSLWNRHDLLVQAEQVADRLPPLIGRTSIDGVLGGTAGCLVSLLTLHRVTGTDRPLQLAVACGDRLIETAQPMPTGSGWSLDDRSPPLSGFAHGAAGIAWALLELAATTGEARYRQMAERAIAYERRLFCGTEGNWTDLRPHDPASHAAGHSPGPILAWCHGAPGIGLARLASRQHLEDNQISREIEVAIDTTLRQGFGGSHALCHGDLGNLELILQAGRILDDSRLRLATEELAERILSDIRSNGASCGVALNVEQPGLMTGLAGIGYGLLRLADPDTIPSVLTLQGPDARQESVRQAN